MVNREALWYRLRRWNENPKRIPSPFTTPTLNLLCPVVAVSIRWAAFGAALGLVFPAEKGYNVKNGKDVSFHAEVG